jgi:hypothetical protein
MSMPQASNTLPIYATAEHLQALEYLIQRLELATCRAEALCLPSGEKPAALPAIATTEEARPGAVGAKRKRLTSFKNAFAAGKLQMGLGLLVGLLGLLVAYAIFFGGVR